MSTNRSPITRRAAVASLAALPAAGAGGPARALGASSPYQRDAEWLRATHAHAGERQRLLGQVASVNRTDALFQPDWASLKQSFRTPSWYADAKFGVFIHYGVYAVPAFGNEWYPCDMYNATTEAHAHHVATYGPLDRFGYKDFIPRFRAENFDPAAWVSLFKQAGARYVVPVAEHHDGFSMYDSRLSDWTAVKLGPRRDILGEVRREVLAQGLRFCLSSHRAEHDFYFADGRDLASDVNDPAFAGLYGPAQTHIEGVDGQDLFGDYTFVSQAWLDDWLARTVELVEVYDPDLVYFDWWIGQPSFRHTVPKFLAYYYNRAASRRKAVSVNYKIGEFLAGTGTLDIERGQAPGISAETWQTCTSISRKSWGYIEGDSYKSATEIVHLLADVVSKNGNLLLNVGPRADGVIPQAAQDTFLKIGAWLARNGEAIYGSRPWVLYGEGPTAIPAGSFNEADVKPYTDRDFRFTTNAGALYAIQLAWPASGRATIRSVRQDYPVRRVSLLGTDAPVAFASTPDGLDLTLPTRPFEAEAYVYRIER